MVSLNRQVSYTMSEYKNPNDFNVSSKYMMGNGYRVHTMEWRAGNDYPILVLWEKTYEG